MDMHIESEPLLRIFNYQTVSLGTDQGARISEVPLYYESPIKGCAYTKDENDQELLL